MIIVNWNEQEESCVHNDCSEGPESTMYAAKQERNQQCDSAVTPLDYDNDQHGEIPIKI